MYVQSFSGTGRERANKPGFILRHPHVRVKFSLTIILSVRSMRLTTGGGDDRRAGAFEPESIAAAPMHCLNGTPNAAGERIGQIRRTTDPDHFPP